MVTMVKVESALSALRSVGGRLMLRVFVALQRCLVAPPLIPLPHSFARRHSAPFLRHCPPSPPPPPPLTPFTLPDAWSVRRARARVSLFSAPILFDFCFALCEHPRWRTEACQALLCMINLHVPGIDYRKVGTWSVF